MTRIPQESDSPQTPGPDSETTREAAAVRDSSSRRTSIPNLVEQIIQQEVRQFHASTEQLKEQNAAMQQELCQLRNQLDSLSAAPTGQSDLQNAAMQREIDRLNARLKSLDSLPIISASQKFVPAIARIKFNQDAAVMACAVVHWIDPNDTRRINKTKELGSYKPVGVRQEFNLAEEGIPDGALVGFSSYVAGIGEYKNNILFSASSSETRGANFTQTGTAFKGWLQYEGLYRPLAIQDNSQAPVSAIARVKYIQNSAVSASLIVHWTDPEDGTSHRKNLSSCKAMGTRQEFNLIEERIPEGSLIRFASNVAGVGEYPNDLQFKVAGSISEGATFIQTGTAFKGFFTFEDLYDDADMMSSPVPPISVPSSYDDTAAHWADKELSGLDATEVPVGPEARAWQE